MYTRLDGTQKTGEKSAHDNTNALRTVPVTRASIDSGSFVWKWKTKIKKTRVCVCDDDDACAYIRTVEAPLPSSRRSHVGKSNRKTTYNNILFIFVTFLYI